MLKPGYLAWSLVLAAVIGGTAILARPVQGQRHDLWGSKGMVPPAPGTTAEGLRGSLFRSKPPRAELEATLARLKEASGVAGEAYEEHWHPVAEAMSSGDVNGARRALKLLVAAGWTPTYNGRIELARFFLQAGGLPDAKQVLDPVVDLSNPVIDPVSVRAAASLGSPLPRGKTPRPIQQCDAEAFSLWEKAATKAPESERNTVLTRWYAHCGTYGVRPTILETDKLTPRALTEFEAGMWCFGIRNTNAEAVEHFRLAVALAPQSIEAKKQLVGALLFVGKSQEAKAVAVQAAKMTDDPAQRYGILWGAHVGVEEAAKLGLVLPRGIQSREPRGSDPGWP